MPTSIKVPKAVFLDVGWTIGYPRASLWEIIAAVARDAGLDLSAVQVEDIVHGLVVGARPQAIAEFRAGKVYTDSDEEFALQFVALSRLVFSVVGGDADHDDLSMRFLDRFWSPGSWEIFPDVFDGVQRLRRAGIRVGVLSNAGSQLSEFLDGLGLGECFDFRVISAIEGTKKPDRRIFERALECAGVDPEEAVHVGDQYLEDILGARSLGIRALLMERGACAMFPHHPESAAHPGESFEITRSLPDVIAAIGLT